jgi:hypothetical protein
MVNSPWAAGPFHGEHPQCPVQLVGVAVTITALVGNNVLTRRRADVRIKGAVLNSAA